MDAALQELFFSETPGQEIEVILKIAKGAAMPPGVREVTRFGDIVTCRLAAGAIPAVRAHESVLSMKAPRLVTTELVGFSNFSRNESIRSQPPTRPNPSRFTGKGVVVGIIDWGFDFTHPNFLAPDGTSRFLKIWDQSAAGDNGNSGKFGYGKVFSKPEINTALGSQKPFQSLGYLPAKSDADGSGTHGTHVSDIATGNGNVGEASCAPESDIVAVHLSTGRIDGRASLGDSVRILEAIDFIAQTAGGRPLVINMSVGRHGGSHQGNSLVEQGIDNFLKEKSGRAIVNSAGNYFQAKAHAQGRLLPAGRETLDWNIPKDDSTANELEIWYSNRDQIRVSVTPPETGGQVEIFHAGQDQKRDIILAGKLAGRIYHRTLEPTTGDNHIDIFLYPGSPHGKWKVMLHGIEIVDGRYQSWIERDSGPQSRFEDSISPFFTTGSICNGLHNIAVGAYDPMNPERRSAGFSSAGPTADGRMKPNLLAPGVGIIAAKSAPASADRSSGELIRKSGTSMAAPHVTGAIAALFEKTGSIPIETTRNLLFASLDPPPATARGQEVHRYGYGYLNIEKLLVPPLEQIFFNNNKISAPMTPETAKSFFDSVAFGKITGNSLVEANDFEIIARPGESVLVPVRADDLVLRRAFGEGLVFSRTFQESGLREGFLNRLGRDTMIVRPRVAVLENEIFTDTEDFSQPSFEMQEATHFAAFSIFNKLLPREKVANCQVEISGGGLTLHGRANRLGSLQIDISTLPDGNYNLMVTAPDVFTGTVGPSTAVGANPPNRIWRNFQTQISIQNQRVSSVTAVPPPGSASMGANTRLVNIGLQPVWMKSPNSWARTSGTIANTIIVHHTAGPVIGPALNTFLSSTEERSAHYVIDTDGEIIKMVQDDKKAGHAGFSHWGGRNGVNGFSIGIEIVNQSGAYPNEQYVALIQLLQSLVSGLGISACQIVGHSDIGTNATKTRPATRIGRKSSDPGVSFDWARLEQAGLGLQIFANMQPSTIFGGFFQTFPQGVLRQGDSDSRQRYGGTAAPNLHGVIAEMQNELVRIGYFCPQNGEFDGDTAMTVQMLQEHFFGGSRQQNLSIPIGRVDFSVATLMKNIQTCTTAPAASPTPAPAPAKTGETEIFADPEDSEDLGFSENDLLPGSENAESCECLHDSAGSAETVAQSLVNLNTLRRSAGTNQIHTIHSRISRETGLMHQDGLVDNPLIKVSDDMITLAYNAHHMHGAVSPPEVLMGIWKKEGSDFHTDPLTFGANGILASNTDNAKILFRSKVLYVEFGTDQFLDYTHVAGTDNLADFSDATAAAHEIAFTTTTNRLISGRFLSRNLEQDLHRNLTVRRLANGRFEVIPTLHFYIYCLLLADALFRENAYQLSRIPALNGASDHGLTYLHWNMGHGNMRKFVPSANRYRAEAQYLINGQPISLIDWTFRRVPLNGEWKGPRENAIKFRYFVEVFGLVFA